MNPKWLLPIHRVHHMQFSYGYVLLPFLPLSIGMFEHGRGHDKNGFWNPKWRIRFAIKAYFHNCTISGIY